MCFAKPLQGKARATNKVGAARAKVPLKKLGEKIIGMGRLATNINVIFCLLSGLKAEPWSFSTGHRTSFCKTMA